MVTPPPLSPVKHLARRLRERRSGPLRRLTLLAAGADKVILDAAPAERFELEVLGSLVLLTTMIAFVAATFATGYIAYGTPRLTATTVSVGAVWAVVIFVVDRSIAKSGLNPYRFPKDALDALWNPVSDSEWFPTLTKLFHEPGAGRRIPQTFSVFAASAARVALAICTSYLFAQFIAFRVFQPEVNARVDYIHSKLIRERRHELHASYIKGVQDRKKRKKALSVVGDDEYQAQTTRIKNADRAIKNAKLDLAKIAQVEAKELDGIPSHVKLSTGLTITTSRQQGIGPAMQSLFKQEGIANGNLADAKANRAQAKRARAARVKAISGRNGKRIAKLDRAGTRASRAYKKAYNNVPGQFSKSGIGIRREALGLLASDVHPESVAPDPYGPCGKGSLHLACVVKNKWFPPTPDGPLIGAFMLALFLIEILPVTVKIRMSLRRRRPYEAVKAAVEEASTAEALDMLDEGLNRAGALMEHRATVRKAGRTGSGADFLLKRQEASEQRRRATTDNDLDERLTRAAPDRSRERRIRDLMDKARAARTRSARRRKSDDEDGAVATETVNGHNGRAERAAQRAAQATIYVTEVRLEGGLTERFITQVGWRHAVTGETGRTPLDVMVNWILRHGVTVLVRDPRTGEDLSVLVYPDSDPPYLRSARQGVWSTELRRLPQF